MFARACATAVKTPAQIQAEFMERYAEKDRLARLGGGQARIDTQVGHFAIHPHASAFLCGKACVLLTSHM